MSAKTVFISYRRDALGKAFARSIKQELTRQGYDVFFDVDSIEPGNWADQIRAQVPLRSHYLMLLTPGALDRCADKDDWVRLEFETAVQYERNIVPVREESVDLAELKRSCPRVMQALFDFQAAMIRQAGFEHDIEELIRRFIPAHKAPPSALPRLILEQRALTYEEHEGVPASFADLRQTDSTLHQEKEVTLTELAPKTVFHHQSINEVGSAEIYPQFEAIGAWEIASSRQSGTEQSTRNSSEEPQTVVGIEFVADGPLSEFDEARWELALRTLLGKDVSKVRIASIRRGSTIVRVLGDPDVIAKAFKQLQTSTQESENFKTSTGLRHYSSLLTTKAGEQIFGRTKELAKLESAWAEDHVNVLSIIGFGGVGKSHLVSHWLNGLASEGWRGAERVFDWSFYSQGVREQGTVSGDAFMAAALVFFGDPSLARSAASPWEKGSRLAQLVCEQRTLLVLDGMEPLQHPPGPLAGQLRDPAVAALLRGLARDNPGLCIVTSRVSVADLTNFRDTTAPEWALENLSSPAAVELLRTMGVEGEDSELMNAVQDVNGHAFTLYLLARYLVSAHSGDIKLRHEIDFTQGASDPPASNAFKTLKAYEKWLASSSEDGMRRLSVLRLLGLFDRPADYGCLAALRRKPIIAGLTEPLVDLNDDEWDVLLRSLADSGLVTVKSAHAAVDAHPIIREYFANELRQNAPKAWLAAHQRVYEHLKDTTVDQPQPTLEDLQPLYQAIAHGCQAELQHDACDLYMKRILRGHERLSWKKLGAFSADLGAISCFFERPYTRISPLVTESEGAFLLDEAAVGLRSLGRLLEAREPMRAAIEKASHESVWTNVARGAGNLSELELTLGEVEAAVKDARKAVAFSDRSRDTFVGSVMRTVLADALCQAGERDDAEANFLQAEAMQIELETGYSLLYSMRGFRYCDLLLASPECFAWRLSQYTKQEPSQDYLPEIMVELHVCRAVAKRASVTFRWATDNNLSFLDIALDQLSLGRANLYEVILEASEAVRPAIPNEPGPSTSSNSLFPLDSTDVPQGGFYAAEEKLNAAVDALRRAGSQDHIPRGLLSRAWLRFLTGACTGPESAQADLDEAWEIAERGPMRLHMADIHLYRARLFGGMKDEGGRMKYPWDKSPDGSPRGPLDDLAAARKLIEQCGYWRRKEELEDAEEAAKNW